MTKQLGRWRSTDMFGASDYIGATPRALASLRQITDPPPAKKARQHIHVHFPPGYGSGAAPRQRTRDQPFDQRSGGEPGQSETARGEAGKLLCTIAQNGQTGEWAAEDGNGRPLLVKSGARGLDVYAAPEDENEAADPDVVGAAPPGAANNLDALRRRIGPRPSRSNSGSAARPGPGGLGRSVRRWRPNYAVRRGCRANSPRPPATP
jgi:hypothetical protein